MRDWHKIFCIPATTVTLNIANVTAGGGGNYIRRENSSSGAICLKCVFSMNAQHCSHLFIMYVYVAFVFVFLHLNSKTTQVTVLTKMTPGATSVCSLLRSDTKRKYDITENNFRNREINFINQRSINHPISKVIFQSKDKLIVK